MKASVILPIIAGALFAQQPPGDNARLAFEVASIKPNNSGSGASSENTSPGRLTAVNIAVSSLIEQAFGVKAFQVSGGPGWLANNRYDIAATTGTSRDLNDRELQPYLQALLADRFGFQYHRETKEMQVYSLVAAKGGARLTAHAGTGDSSPRIFSNGNNGSGKSSIVSTNISLARLADVLGRRLDRPVIDHTGLKGSYDLKLEWAQDPTPDSTEPSLFTALQEQLGLKLESAKGPVEIIAIDHVEKPSEN